MAVLLTDENRQKFSETIDHLEAHIDELKAELNHTTELLTTGIGADFQTFYETGRKRTDALEDIVNMLLGVMGDFYSFTEVLREYLKASQTVE